MRRTPVLIVGGGPAGAAAAITLAQAGHAPEILERTTGAHDGVCGGFMSADTLASLEALGLEPADLGARPISALRLVSDARDITLPLPFAAAGLSRRRLDEALLAAAEREGANVRRGMAARMTYPASRSVRTHDDEIILYDALFLATGKHELRGFARPKLRSGRLSVGLRAELPVSAKRTQALAGFIELHLFEDGYAGLLLQENGSCNLCLSVSSRALAEQGGVTQLVERILAQAPLLLERIGGDLPGHWQAIAGVPYGWSTRNTHPGLFRLGDQAGVIASIAGDGLGLALASGRSAAKAFVSGGPGAAAAWQRRFRQKLRMPVAVSEFIRSSAARRLPRALLMALVEAIPGVASLAARVTRVTRV